MFFVQFSFFDLCVILLIVPGVVSGFPWRGFLTNIWRFIVKVRFAILSVLLVFLVTSVTNACDFCGAEMESSGWHFTRSFSYHSKGVEDILPHHVFGGDILGQKVVVGYNTDSGRPNIFFGLNYLQSPSGGSLNDPGDRVIAFAGMAKQFGQFNLQLHHMYRHTSMVDQWFWHLDRHMTIFKAGFNAEKIEPYIFFASDVPSHTPVGEGYFFGGMGVALGVEMNMGILRDINFNLSLAESLVDYYRDSVTGLRFKVDTGVDLGFLPVIIKPEFNVMKDLRSDEEYSSWFGVSSFF